MYEDSKLSSSQRQLKPNTSSSSKRLLNSTSNKKLINSSSSSSSLKRAQQQPYLKAVEAYRKLCIKSYTTPNPSFIALLKTGNLNIFLDNYTLKDIININKIISKHYIFKQIILSPFDLQKGESNDHRRSKPKTSSSLPLTQVEKDKEQREHQQSKLQMLYHIVQAIAKNLCMSNKVNFFSLYQLTLTKEHTSFISEGINENKSLQGFFVRNCTLPLDAYEILLKGLLTHERVEFLDLSENNLTDKYGNMISRIIARQTQRRDQVIWAYGLRNERPLTNDYTKGLISINLSGNKLGEMSAEQISNALMYDQYIRAIDLSSNDFSDNACKKFIYMMRKNRTLLMINLKDNPGYDLNIHARLVMKMANNIKVLYQQFRDRKFEMEEFVSLKGFIDPTFFDVDMPEEIAREFMGEGEMEGEGVIGEEEEEEGDEEEQQQVHQDEDNDEDVQSSEHQQQQQHQQQYQLQQVKEANKGKVNVVNKNTNKQMKQQQQSVDSNSHNKDEQTINADDINQVLLSENLRLKQELLEIRGHFLEQEIMLQQSKHPEKLSENALNNYNKIVTLINELNNLMDNVEDSIQKDGDNEDDEEEEVKAPTIKEEDDELKSASRDNMPLKKQEHEHEEEEGDYKYQEMQAEPSEPNEDVQGDSNQMYDDDDEDDKMHMGSNNNNIMVNHQEMMMMRNDESNDYEYDDDEYDPPSLDIKKRLNNSR